MIKNNNENPYQDDTMSDVTYIITIPTIKPEINGVFNHVFFRFLSSTCAFPLALLLLSDIQETIENIT